MIAAIVPAAGRSGRMGCPKLLLKHNGRSILAGVVGALLQGGADPVVVVVPPETEPEGPTLAHEALNAGGSVIAPAIRPAEMRDSIEVGLSALAGQAGSPPDAVLIAPADSPGITPDLVGRVIGLRKAASDSIVIPSSEGRRGHPILIPWETAARIRDLPPDVGINVLVAGETAAGRVIEIELSEGSALADLDTPEDWERWQARSRESHETKQGRRRIAVRLFALARQRANQPEIVVEVADGATVADLKVAIAKEAPSLVDLLPLVMIAVDSDYATDDLVVPPDAQVAVIPPVSGGAGPEERHGDVP
jgi:molybdenum cofactor cytidylyltransferase